MKNNTWFKFIIFIGVFSILISSSINGNSTSYLDVNEHPSAKTSSLADFDISVPIVTSIDSNVDGQIGVDEYPEFFIDPTTGITVYWQYDLTNMAIGLVSKSTGWVAIGFGDGMNSANMILGGFSSSSYCYDLFGTSATTHNEDKGLSGSTDDLVSCGATENSTNTIFEFIFPMNPGDSRDPVLAKNSHIGIFFAYQQSSDSLAEKHTAYSKVYEGFFRPETTPIQSFLSLTISPTHVERGHNFTLTVKLTFISNSNPVPIANQQVDFFMQSALENVSKRIIIGSVITNLQGEGFFSFNDSIVTGERTFGAIFKSVLVDAGSVLILYSEAVSYASISIQTPEEPQLGLKDYFVYFLFGSIFLVVLAVFMIYGYAYFSAIRIYLNRDRTGKKDEKTKSLEG
jgi:hypothetical protein